MDDFSGSGRTIIDYFKILEQYIEIDIGIIIICLHSMVNAERKIEDYFESSKFKEFYFFTNRENPESRKKYFSRRKDELRKEIRKMKTAERIIGKYLESSKLEKFYFFTNRESLELIKKYFSRRQDELKKEIHNKDELKKEIREFEKKKFEQQYALGFQATESLVATYDSCPNNTFSSFWYSENDDWSPLFKRPRKQSNALDDLNLDKNTFVNEVKTGLKIRKVEDKDIEQIIILLCVKLMKGATTTRVAIEIEDKFYYNGERLQEYLSNKYIKIINNGDGSSNYSLTQKGKSKLKEYQMSYMTFEKLVEIANVFDAKDSISINDTSSYEIGLLNKSAE
ncbi:phosphoribosyltransferase-like protein [Streptococcus suis]|uniref:phosphoribosyltransferase-like protein n=1 Tax=Streptococcus suis TaxID=1307 RepID=UPI003F4DE2E7